MLVTSLFLSTVTKAPLAVRFELVGGHLVGGVTFIIARLFGAELLERYALAIARLCCLALVGYSVITNFDSSFTGVVRKSSGYTVAYINKVRSIMKI